MKMKPMRALALLMALCMTLGMSSAMAESTVAPALTGAPAADFAAEDTPPTPMPPPLDLLGGELKDGALRLLGEDLTLVDVDTAVTGAAALEGDVYYLKGDERALMVYDAATSAPREIAKLGAEFTGQLASDGNRLFANTVLSDIRQIDPETGAATSVVRYSVNDPSPVLHAEPGLLTLWSSFSGDPQLLFSFDTELPGDDVKPSEDELPVLDEPTDEPMDVPEGLLSGDDEEDFAADAAPTLAPAATRRPDKTAGPSGYASLARGDHGELVKKLQQRLISLGYLSGGADGDFGYNTQQAVKAFQKRSKLDEDGVASIELQKKLHASSALKALPAYSELEKGDKGDAVTRLQQRLKKLHYYAGPEDGKFSSELQTAVKLFQKAVDLKQTGKASVETQKKLFATSAPKHSLNKYIALRPGDSGERVKKLQKRLQKLGYFTGEIGGHYQTLTTKAVKRFQKQIGEDADGIASVELQKQIFSDDAEEYEG